MKYSDFMYDVTGDAVCFVLKAFEASNPYRDPGESTSPAACIPVASNILVPNTFTPDGNGINDLFFPVLSFTPDDFYLLITDMRRRKVFETRNFMDKWDGRFNGAILPEGAYLWMLKARTPSGDTVTKSGTVALIFNR
jgi:gliding motility-associated-like protein